MTRGSCLCGGVVFEIDGKTTDIGMCHCSKCRKVSGVASNASLMIPKEGLKWLAGEGFNLRVAGRSCWGEPECETRLGYARLFADLALPVDASDPEALVIFPEMDADLDIAEITERCWDILGVHPQDMMCATSRMVVKRKGEDHPVVMPCTLLPYQDDFVMGRSLADAAGSVKLNHPHCARFCVLGGGSCSKAG